MNNNENISKNVEKIVKKMPFFRIENLLTIIDNKKYLRILLSRMSRKSEIIRVKKGIYVSAAYLNEIKIKGASNDYSEYIGCQIYEPSYLSAEYILSGYGVLPESVYGFSLVSLKKTNSMKNDLGIFTYHHIKKELFTGYEIKKTGGFLIRKASPAKALFDFLYFRKNIIVDFDNFNELRLNLGNLKNKDINEFNKYIKSEGSKKMKDICDWVIKTYE
jgi:predicted transcriptional regulator of viral defense system